MSLVHRGGGKAKYRKQVFLLQIWIFIQNLPMGHALCEQADHGRHGDTESAHTRRTPHLIGLYGNSSDCHLSDLLYAAVARS